MARHSAIHHDANLPDSASCPIDLCSLSMAARCKSEVSQNMEVVKAPGQFVLSCYCSVPDITLTVTPGESELVLIPSLNFACLCRISC